MVGRLLRVASTVLVIAVAFVTPVLITSTPASADTVVNGCTIVSNPTPTNFTNCTGADLSGANLSGVDLSDANLAGASFANCPATVIPTCMSADLSRANLTDANLSGASFFGCQPIRPIGPCVAATLNDSNLTAANLSNASLAGCFAEICANVDLSEANLMDADLTGASLEACPVGPSFLCFSVVLRGANLTGTLFLPSGQTVQATSTAGAVVTWTVPAPLVAASPGSCTPPSGSTFPVGNTTVTCQVLDDQGDVATGTFTVTVLRPISQISIPCNKLAGCNLTGFDLSYTILAGADLHGANLMDANLTSDVLSGADLGGANLKGANLSGANLSGANLNGANLNGANLTGANLSGVNVTVNTNVNCVTWGNTTCPDGTNSDNDGGTCVRHL